MRNLPICFPSFHAQGTWHPRLVLRSGCDQRRWLNETTVETHLPTSQSPPPKYPGWGITISPLCQSLGSFQFFPLTTACSQKSRKISGPSAHSSWMKLLPVNGAFIESETILTNRENGNSCATIREDYERIILWQLYARTLRR